MYWCQRNPCPAEGSGWGILPSPTGLFLSKHTVLWCGTKGMVLSKTLVAGEGLWSSTAASRCVGVCFEPSLCSESPFLPGESMRECGATKVHVSPSFLPLMKWGKKTNVLLVLSSRGGFVSCYVGKKIPHQRTGPSGRISPWSEGSSVFLSLNAMPFMNKKAMQFITMVTGLPTLSMCQQNRFRLVYLGQSRRALSK